MAMLSVHMDLDAPVDRQALHLSQRDNHSIPMSHGGGSGRIPLHDISDHALKQSLVTNQSQDGDAWILGGKSATNFECLRAKEGTTLGEEGRADTMERSGENNTATSSPHKEIAPTPKDPQKPHQEMTKPKLSAAEKQAREQERLEKARVREAEKARKEEAKRQRDEERAKEKARKDEQKARKEEEKAKKEEEKAKKERAQMRLGTFFARTKEPSSSPLPSRQASLEPGVVAEKDAGSTSRKKDTQTDFDKAFPPFFLHPHTKLASAGSHPFVGQGADEVWQQVREVKQSIEGPSGRFARLRARTNNTNITRPSLRELIDHCMNSDRVIDLTSRDTTLASAGLSELAVKFLKYHEDVRPPYIGTFTKMPSFSGPKLGRNPFKRAFDSLNYDYDSEAEWEDGEEGEDLDSEGEEEALDEEEEDMEDFIDDEGAEQPSPKRQKLDASQEPVSTGPSLYWQEDLDNCVIPYGKGTIDMAQFEAVCLLPGVNGGIDPWSTKYWETEPSSKGRVVAPETSKDAVVMGPPSETSQVKGLKGRVQTATPIPAELVGEFKTFVVGKTLSKIGMIEVLKDRFPQYSKATLTKTLLQLAKREGGREAEKRWISL